MNGVDFVTSAALSARSAVSGCPKSASATKRLNTYQRRNPNGVAKLECGNANYGWRHIVAGKARSWQGIIDKCKLNTDWETFAKWNISNTVGAPASAKYERDKNAYVYRAPLQIKNSKGQVVRTYTVRIPVGKSTERIITAFPE